MKTTLSIIAIATLALVGFSTQAKAQGHEPCDWDTEKCQATLHLSFYQERQIDQFRDAAVRQSNRVVAQIDQKQDELRYLSRAYRPNPIAIAHKRAELNALRDRQQGIWTNFRLQVQSVLNPIQRMKLANCTSRGFDHGRDRMFESPKGIAYVPVSDHGPKGVAFVPGRNSPMRGR